MSKLRTYFTKNNTIISNNRVNNSQNPVTELSYGLNNQVSRFIFDFDLEKLKNKILNNGLNQNSIISHKLYIQNTINVDNKYVGGFFQNKNSQRTSSFDLELFKIEEEWDEGFGYDFIYNKEEYPKSIESASNWYERKNNEVWLNEGVFDDGLIIGEQHFDSGNENIEIDITEYVNNLIFSGDTSHHGIGIKYSEEFEEKTTNLRQTVAFHTKYTHTFFEPYIETYIDDVISDDRDCFYIDKDNYLYLVFKVKNKYTDIAINNVEIVDYNGNIIDTLTTFEKIKNGVYRIEYKVNSNEYPDRVIFYDKWNISFNGINKEIIQKFYIKPLDEYYSINNQNILNPDNFSVNIVGIKNEEIIKNKEIKNINIFIKSMYQHNYEIDLYYSLYIRMSNNHIINIIDIEKINKIDNNYFFDLDTSWLVEQDYYIDFYIGNEDEKYNLKTIKFKIPSNI